MAQQTSLAPCPKEDLCIVVVENGRTSYILIDMAYIDRGDNATSPAETKEQAMPDFELQSDVDFDYAQLPPEVCKRLAAYAELNLLCDFCLELRNLEWVDGELEQVFCKSCRWRIIKSPIASCTGGTPKCTKTRFVDKLGSIAPMCRGCHQEARRE